MDEFPGCGACYSDKMCEARVWSVMHTLHAPSQMMSHRVRELIIFPDSHVRFDVWV